MNSNSTQDTTVGGAYDCAVGDTLRASVAVVSAVDALYTMSDIKTLENSNKGLELGLKIAALSLLIEAPLAAGLVGTAGTLVAAGGVAYMGLYVADRIAKGISGPNTPTPLTELYKHAFGQGSIPSVIQHRFETVLNKANKALNGIPDAVKSPSRLPTTEQIHRLHERLEAALAEHDKQSTCLKPPALNQKEETIGFTISEDLRELYSFDIDRAISENESQLNWSDKSVEEETAGSQEGTAPLP